MVEEYRRNRYIELGIFSDSLTCENLFNSYFDRREFARAKVFYERYIEIIADAREFFGDNHEGLKNFGERLGNMKSCLNKIKCVEGGLNGK